MTLTGNAEIGYAAGSWRGIDTVTEGHNRILVLDDYTGTCGTISDFDLVTVDNHTTAAFTAASAVTNWSFDGRGRGDDDALLKIGSVDFAATSAVDLRVASEDAGSITEWSLATGAQSFTGVSFNLYFGSESVTGLSLGQQIGSGDFAGYGFTVDADSTLKFAKLSA